MADLASPEQGASHLPVSKQANIIIKMAEEPPSCESVSVDRLCQRIGDAGKQLLVTYLRTHQPGGKALERSRKGVRHLVATHLGAD